MHTSYRKRHNRLPQQASDEVIDNAIKEHKDEILNEVPFANLVRPFVIDGRSVGRVMIRVSDTAEGMHSAAKRILGEVPFTIFVDKEHIPGLRTS